MKKFTAIVLVVLLLVMSVPFTAFAAIKWTEVKTAEDFANMTNGKYWLTADIDLSKAAWTTIPEFSGTLNGNGHTVTVPADAPIFDQLSGTVKNVNLKGTVALDAGDVSSKALPGSAQNTSPVGVLANWTNGATIENVHTAAVVTFNSGRTAKPSSGYAIGGLVGATLASYELETSGETKTVKFINNTTIKNVSNTGKMTVDFTANTMNRDQFGGIVGTSLGNVDISLALVSAELVTLNGGGNEGGIVGYIHGNYTAGLTGASGECETEAMAVTLTDCLFNGTYAHSGAKGERFAGIAGYAHNVVMKNCVNEGSATQTSGKSIAGLLGYGNCGNDTGKHWVLVENSVAVGAKGCGTWTNVKAAAANADKPNPGHLEYKNIPLLAENTLNGSSGSAPAAVETNVKKYEAKSEVRAAFLANGASNFEIKNEVLTLKMPTFTPEADPDFGGNQGGNDNVQTGDMTMVLVVVSVVSLAAVTVIAKKKVTE